MKLLLIDDCDFVIAKSEEEAISFYKKEFEMTDEDFKLINVKEIPSDKWKEINLIDYDSETSDDEKYSLNELINNHIEQSEEPGIIASIEY
jgi:hypothetical protein